MDFQPGTTPGDEITFKVAKLGWDGEKWNLQSAQALVVVEVSDLQPPLNETANNVSFVWSSTIASKARNNMALQSSDLLLVGRGGISYYTTAEEYPYLHSGF